MLKFKKSLLALTALTLLSVYVFAKDDNTNKEPAAPNINIKTDSPCKNIC